MARDPGAGAVRDARGSWTYREVDEYSRAFRAWLVSQGVRPGERVLVQTPTDRELVAMFMGCSRAGAIFVPINVAMRAFLLKSVVRNAEPSLVIGDTDRIGTLREVASVPVHEVGSVWKEVEALRDAPGTFPLPDPGTRLDDVASLVYTSGSTAAPKAVACSHGAATFATRSIDAELRYRSDDVVFCRFPMSWDYGLYKVMLAFNAGSQIVLAGGESDLLLLRRIRETGATIIPIVPSLATMIVNLLRRESEPLRGVRMFTNTGAALASSTIEALHESFPGARVVRQFGQTECKRIAVMPPEEESERPESVGRPLPGTRVHILDHAGDPLPTGAIGEIVVTGPHLMAGYWRDPELTASTFRTDPRTGERRLHTGDYGRLDEDGYLYFDGRRDDMFKRKGIRMSTLEIEAAAMDVPGVRAAAILPPTDDRDLAVCVAADLEPHAVLQEMGRRLEPAKVPAVCHVLEELPLTAHGKNATRVLAEMFYGEKA
ncbi:MAG: hypothetical protein QG608_1813 [Actinomycetota bacterium]|nr:hypothetical protein [Actinomycetota bacterium]